MSGLYVFAQAATLGLFVLGMLLLTLFDAVPFLEQLRFAFPLGLVAFSCVCLFLAIGPAGPGFRAIFARPLALPEEQKKAFAGRELCIHACLLLVPAVGLALHGFHILPKAPLQAAMRLSAGLGGTVLLASSLYHFLCDRPRWPHRVQMFSMVCAFYPPSYAAWGLVYGGFFFFGL